MEAMGAAAVAAGMVTAVGTAATAAEVRLKNARSFSPWDKLFPLGLCERKCSFPTLEM